MGASTCAPPIYFSMPAKHKISNRLTQTLQSDWSIDPSALRLPIGWICWNMQFLCRGARWLLCGSVKWVWWEFGGRSANCKSATMLPARLLTPCVPTLFLLTIVTKPPINWHKIDVVTLLSKSAVKEWYRSGLVRWCLWWWWCTHQMVAWCKLMVCE